MPHIKLAFLLFASSFVFGPAASLAQAQEAQSATPTALVVTAPSSSESISTVSIGRSQTEQYKALADERAREIDSVRSDIADLSKFEHGNEYLPKSIYKRNYVDKRDNAPVIAGHQKPNYGVEHRM